MSKFIYKSRSTRIKTIAIDDWLAHISFVEPVTENGQLVQSYYSWWAIEGEWDDDHHDFGRHETVEAAEKSLQAWFGISDMGSLDPIDIGFDLRVQKTAVVVPVAGFVRVRLPRSKRRPNGRTVEGRRWFVVQSLQSAGFVVSRD